MELIDTHAHLYVEEFNDEQQQVLKRAGEEGVSRIILPAIDSKTHQAMMTMAETYPQTVFPLMGLHPTSVNGDYKKELALVEQFISQRSLFHGIGEIGIDLYWDKSHYQQQVDAFQTQVKWAKELGWPIIIHTRNSFEETYKALEPMADSTLTGIFHCFGGTIEEANLITQLGFYLGIGGVATFKNSTLPIVLKQVNIKHIVLETDSPYLAPVPFRGKRNESSYLKYVAEKVADIYDIPVADVAQQTTQNAKRVFNTI